MLWNLVSDSWKEKPATTLLHTSEIFDLLTFLPKRRRSIGDRPTRKTPAHGSITMQKKSWDGPTALYTHMRKCILRVSRGEGGWRGTVLKREDVAKLNGCIQNTYTISYFDCAFLNRILRNTIDSQIIGTRVSMTNSFDVQRQISVGFSSFKRYPSLLKTLSLSEKEIFIYCRLIDAVKRIWYCKQSIVKMD